MKFTYQSYEQLLKYHTELEIINRYYPIPGVQKYFKSPFRKEKHPSALFYPTKGGRLRYNDFQISEGVLGFIALLYNIGIKETEKMILNDFSGNISNKKRNPIKTIKKYKKLGNKPTIIQPIYRQYRQYDFDYWMQGGITKEWLTHPTVNIYPATKIKIDSKKGNFIIRLDKLAYIYPFHIFDNIRRYKVYQPDSLNMKWITNSNTGVGGVVQGWETLPKNNNNNLCVISSSFKDSGVIECNARIPSFAPNNEGAWLPSQIIPKLNQRYNKILTWFDNDEPGIKAAKKYKEKYGYDYIHIPLKFKEKDQFAFRKKYGEKEFIQLTNYLIKDYI